MRKGLLITVDFWPRTGGVALYYYMMLTHTRCFEPYVLTVPTGKLTQKEQKLETPHYPIHRKPFYFKYIWPHWMRLFLELYKLQKKEKFDFFLVGDVLPVGTVALLFFMLFKIPYIVFVHGTDIIYGSQTKRKLRLMKKIFRYARCVVANSQFTKLQLLRLNISKTNIKVLYPCINIDNKENSNQALRKQLIQRYNLENKKILLTVCRLVERKGIQYVINALAEVFHKHPEWMYVIVGDGPYKKNLQEKSREQNLSNRVFILDDVSDSEKYEWFRLSEIFIMTPVQLSDGDYEGFGIVYLEAGFFSLPVIASHSGGVSEAVEDAVTGVIVQDPTDKEKLSRIIEKLFVDENLRKELGKNGKRRAEYQFSCFKQKERFEYILIESAII